MVAILFISSISWPCAQVPPPSGEPEGASFITHCSSFSPSPYLSLSHWRQLKRNSDSAPLSYFIYLYIIYLAPVVIDSVTPF